MIKSINRIILLLMLLGSIITLLLTKRILLLGAFLIGSSCFLLLFLHLQYIFKGNLTKPKKIYFTYFIRLLLIIFVFYVSIKISKEFFIVSLIGFIVSSFSLMIGGLLIVFKNGGTDGRA